MVSIYDTINMKLHLHYSDSGFSTNPNSFESTIRFSYICMSTVNLNYCLVIGPYLKLLLLSVFHCPALDGNLSVSIRPKLAISLFDCNSSSCSILTCLSMKQSEHLRCL